MQIFTLILSVVGAVLGVASFYLTQLRPPRIAVIAERRIRIGYAWGGPGFGVHVPLTFVNTSQRTGTVYKVTLVIRALDGGEPAYCIDLSRFVELDPARNGYKDVALPHAFTIPGNSSVSKLVKFMWWNDSRPLFVLGAKRYGFSLLVWTNPGPRPDATDHHVLEPTASEAAIMEENRLAGNADSIEVVLDRGTPGNRALSLGELLKEFGHYVPLDAVPPAASHFSGGGEPS